MRVRSITQFIPLTWPFTTETIAGAARLLTDARARLVDAGIEVESLCLATPPFLDVLGDPKTSLLLKFAGNLDDMADQYHLDQISIGPVIATTPLALLMPIHALPQLIAETRHITTGVLFADRYSGVNLAAAHHLAEAILQIAHTTPEGKGNLRLAALANVPAFMPFAPVAYHQGGVPAFAMSTESEKLVLEAIGQTNSIIQAHKRLTGAIESAAAPILKIADALARDHHVEFKGIDLSLTPSAREDESIGAAVEKLGVDIFGGSGTLFAMSLLTNALHRVNMPHVGFSGVGLPILADPVLAKRAEEGRFSVNDLLLYSAVCNAGLDLIPIPGNTTSDEMAALFLDMAALALTMNKPMSARLLPIPNAKVGRRVSLAEAGLVNGRVIPVKNLGTHRLFEQDTFLTMFPLKSNHRRRRG
jgi:hypothetical protein